MRDPGSGPQPEERHRQGAREIARLIGGLELYELTNVSEWLARFEAEVRGRCADEVDRYAATYKDPLLESVTRGAANLLRGGGSRSEEGGA